MASHMVCHIKRGPVGRSYGSISRKLKQTRRRRKRERHLIMSLRVSAIIFQLFKVFQIFKVIMPEKGLLTILELNWSQRLGQDKIEHLSSYAYVVHTTAKKVISRHRKNENVFKMSKDEKCTYKACKHTVLIVKYANLCGLCCRRRRGCLRWLPIALTVRTPEEGWRIKSELFASPLALSSWHSQWRLVTQLGFLFQ